MTPSPRPLRVVPVVFAVLLAAGALPACAGSASIGEPPTQAAGETRAPLAVTAHGPLKLGVDALGEVPLRADQRQTIEQMVTDAETRHDTQRTAREQLMIAVADQVQAGALDRAALQPKIDASAAAFEKSRPADRAALEKLHALLTPAQRTAFVDAVRARMQEKHAHHEGAGKGMRMRQWADDLKLTDEQRAHIRDKMIARFQPQGGQAAAGQAMAHWGHGKERLDHILDAFKTDHFVMDEVAPPVDAKQTANEIADHVLDFAGAVLPELTPEQRSIAAQKIRERASHAGAEAHPLAP